jgi:hypothetical protein
MFEGNVHFVYQTVSGAIMVHLPEEEDRLLMAERLENCRFRELTLIEWNERLYLLYIAWNGIKERYSLKLRDIGREGEELLLEDNVSKKASVHTIAEGGELVIQIGKQGFRLSLVEDRKIRIQKEYLISQKELAESKKKMEEQENEWKKQLVAERERLDSASRQYNELTVLAKKLQQEGKYWRDSYYQEIKKQKRKGGAVKVKRETLK